ncbi:FeoA family protein [Salinisphaera sp. SPP-AMP-43]|uniref:FeoA family protein n=1 Tax=Salinisphaera sp. SPP-AMP-43 TaxID=3121288 RepID=UPI003C6E1300
MQLSELAKRCPARVTAIRDEHPDDAIAQRLRDLGFVPGETVEIVARAPFGGDPILVRIGGTRFALRRSEAARIAVDTLENVPT